MINESLWKKLVELGLTEDEAKILVSLYITGNSKANSIARAVVLPRIRVYRALKGLQEKSLIESHLGRPVIFSAVPIELALKNLITYATVRLENMETIKEEFMNEMSNFKIPVEQQREDKYRIIQGRGSIFATIAKMITSAMSEIIMFIANEELIRMYYSGIIDTFTAAQAKGIKITILTEIDRSNLEIIEKFTKYFTMCHAHISGISIFLVVDDSELLQCAMAKETEASTDSESIAIWTNAKSFALGTKELLKESQENSIDAQTRIKMLTNSTSDTQDIVVIRGYDDTIKLFSNMLSKANNEILAASFPYDLKFFDATINPIISKLAKRNVKLKIMTSVNDQNTVENIIYISKFADIRHMDIPAMTNILLIDETEAVVLPSTSLTARPFAIWSNLKEHVERYKSIFNNMWIQSSTMSQRLASMEESNLHAMLEKELHNLIKEFGYDIKISIKGMSGLTHNFDFVCTDDEMKEVLVVDLVTSKDEERVKTSIISFVSKCLDVRAEQKLLIIDVSSELIEHFARPFNHIATIVNKEGMKNFFETLKQKRYSMHP